MKSVYLLLFLTISTYACRRGRRPHHGNHHDRDLVIRRSIPNYDYNENDYETEYQTPDYQEYPNTFENEGDSSSGYFYNDDYIDKRDFSNPCPYFIHT